MNYYGGSQMNQANAMGGHTGNPEGMRNALAPPIEKDSVMSRVSALEAQLLDLGSELNELESRLAPVLADPSPQAEEKVRDVSEPSVLMQRLGTLNARASYLTHVVRTVVRRVTL
jgi:hypothetical protein